MEQYQQHPNYIEQDQALTKCQMNITEKSISMLLKTINLELISYEEHENSNGVINPVYFLKAYSILNKTDVELVLRIANPHTFWTKIKTENEVTIMNQIQKHSKIIPIPKIILSSYDEQQSPLHCEFILMERVKGIILEDYLLRQKMPLDIQLAKKILAQGLHILSELQKIPIPKNKICAFNNKLDQVKITQDGPTLGPFNTVKEYLIESIKNSIYYINKKQTYQEIVYNLELLLEEILIGKYDSLLNTEANFQLCHRDLHQGNIMVDSVSGDIIGVLDWEDVKVCVQSENDWNLAKIWFKEYISKEDLIKELIPYQEKLIQQYNIYTSKNEKQFQFLLKIVETSNWITFYCSSWWRDQPDKQACESIESLTNVKALTKLLKKHNLYHEIQKTN